MQNVTPQTHLQHHIPCVKFSVLQESITVGGLISKGKKKNAHKKWSGICGGRVCHSKLDLGYLELCSSCWPGSAQQGSHSCTPGRPPEPLVRPLGPAPVVTCCTPECIWHRLSWRQLVTAQGVLTLVVPREPNIHAHVDTAMEAAFATCVTGVPYTILLHCVHAQRELKFAFKS